MIDFQQHTHCKYKIYILYYIWYYLIFKNATQLPTKSFQEKTIGQDVLRQQFPVSSGQIHSLAVNEWVPIGPEESAKLNKIPRSDEGSKLSNKLQIQQAPKVVPVRFIYVVNIVLHNFLLICLI